MEMRQANRCGDEKMINKWARDKLVDRLRIDTRIKRKREKIAKSMCVCVREREREASEYNNIKMKSSYAVMKNASDVNNIITLNYVDCLDFLQSILTKNASKK